MVRLNATINGQHTKLITLMASVGVKRTDTSTQIEVIRTLTLMVQVLPTALNLYPTCFYIIE